MRRLLAVLIFTTLAYGSDPKPKAEDYEAHGQASGAVLGAEFLVHSFSGHGLTYLAPDYLVVDVALYPPKNSEIDVTAGAFRLRLNGRRTTLDPASPEMVAASLQHPEWRDTPGVEAGAGLPGGAVILGAPRQSQTPYPGQPPQSHPPRPGPDENPAAGGVASAPKITAQELLLETALPQGKHHGPVCGFLYFPYHGKVGSLKTVELLFEDAVLKVR